MKGIAFLTTFIFLSITTASLKSSYAFIGIEEQKLYNLELFIPSFDYTIFVLEL
jgi:hypothetical protein